MIEEKENSPTPHSTGTYPPTIEPIATSIQITPRDGIRLLYHKRRYYVPLRDRFT